MSLWKGISQETAFSEGEQDEKAKVCERSQRLE